MMEFRTESTPKIDQQPDQQPDPKTELAALMAFISAHGGTLRLDQFNAKLLFHLGFICDWVAKLTDVECAEVEGDHRMPLEFFSQDAKRRYQALSKKIIACESDARQAEDKGFARNPALQEQLLGVASEVRMLCKGLALLIEWLDTEAERSDSKLITVENAARIILKDDCKDNLIADILGFCALIEGVLTPKSPEIIPCLKAWCDTQVFIHKSTSHDASSPKAKVAFDNQIPKGIGVKGDPIILSFVIARLLSNAQQHLPNEEAQIKVVASLNDDGEVRLAVENPVNPEKVRIREIRLDPDREQVYHGVALPCVRAVMRHVFGGDVSLSQRDDNVVASLTLPKSLT